MKNFRALGGNKSEDGRSDEEARKHPSTVISNIKNIRILAMRELEESEGSFGSKRLY
ncbi:hypothetical protein [Clostridioides sp. ES-S-0108-01]|uniref:hypothetical protein n=1 Tax=Clostridioides sp. ES-S-0108-01 TaxID=2770773 RepID=UPI001D0CC034